MTDQAIGNAAFKETAVSRLIEGLKVYGGLKGRDIANILGVSPPTVSRWSKGDGGPTIARQTAMAELRWVAERLADFYEPDEARLWLQSPHPQLHGERPYELINQGRTSEVLEILERLDSGVYL
ncbi:MAG: antitoxin Xre/MbcA/ParS toxin-binding domain-containing protein [Pseudomonadota bacterium]